MQAIQSIETVGENGRLELRIDKPAGTRVKVIILELDNTSPATEASSDSLVLARHQETTGFASTVLAHVAEDVWNDL